MAVGTWPSGAPALHLRFDAKGMMLDAEIAEGKQLGQRIERYFANRETACIHLRDARANALRTLPLSPFLHKEQCVATRPVRR